MTESAAFRLERVSVTYGGKVAALDAAAGVATLEIEGVNQLGEVTTKGRAEVRLPRRT